MVGGEDIDRNYGVQAETADNFNVLEKVCAARANLFNVFLGHGIGQGFARSKPVLTGVRLECANRCDDHRAIGAQTAHGALDIEETLGTHIRTKTGLGHHVITVLSGKTVRNHRGTTRCNIAEGAGVNQDRAALSCAQKVRAECIAKKSSHCSRSLQVLGRDIFAGLILTDHNASQTLAEVRVRGGKGHDDHNLAGGGDIKGRLTSHAINCATQARDDVTQRAVINVQNAWPRDGAFLDVELISLMQVVIDHCRQQVVCSCDRVEIAGQVQIHLLEWQDLALAIAGRSAFDAESRAH